MKPTDELTSRDFRKVAFYQRYIWFYIVAFPVLALLLTFVALPEIAADLVWFVGFSIYWSGCAASVLLTRILYPTNAGYVVGALIIIPVINFIPLFVVNATASRLLKGKTSG